MGDAGLFADPFLMSEVSLWQAGAAAGARAKAVPAKPTFEQHRQKQV